MLQPDRALPSCCLLSHENRLMPAAAVPSRGRKPAQPLPVYSLPCSHRIRHTACAGHLGAVLQLNQCMQWLKFVAGTLVGLLPTTILS